MKHFLFTFVLAALCLSASAQQVTGTFAPLKDVARVKLVIDYSEADIMGMSEAQFAEFEEDWERDRKEVLFQFNNKANEILKGRLTLGNYNFETEYTLNVIVRSVDAKGNHDCDVILTDRDGEEVARAAAFLGDGGLFGTKLHLIKAGAKHTGENLLLKQLGKK